MQNQFNLTTESSYKTSPKYSFTSAASKEHKRNIPGPGAYGTGIPADRDKFHRSASWTMGGSGRDGKAVGQFPGPGAYKPEIVSQAPRWGFSSEDRLRVKKQMPSPGPGAYHNAGSMDGRQFSLSGKPEGKKRAATPGPGAYQPNFTLNSNIETIPKVSFGNGQRGDLALSKTPGPGAYNHEAFLNNSKSGQRYSIQGRYAAPAPDRTPGPMGPHTQFK